VQVAHHIDRVGGQIEPGGTLAEAFREAVLAKADLLHVGRRRQRGEHQIDRLGQGARALHPHRAGIQMPRRRLPRQVVHDEVVPGLLQIAGHAGTHHAEPDESDFHLRFPPRTDPAVCDELPGASSDG
jgi:hypothetical protein